MVRTQLSAEEEPAVHHAGGGRRGLGDHRGVHARRGAGDAGAEPQALGAPRDAADHGPYERAVTLPVGPRVVVVGDEREREAGVLCGPCLRDQLVRAELL